MDIRIIGRLKSRAVKRIVKKTNLNRYSKICDIVVNYGLAGKKMEKFLAKHPSLKTKPMINKYIGCSKYKAINDAKNHDIVVPKTFLSLSKEYKISDFINKRIHSQGGIGICKATVRSKIIGNYYQEFIQNRLYELRVHGFKWTDSENWLIQKRFGKEDEIAWNYHNGGRFQTIRNPKKYDLFTKAKEITTEVLKIRNMSFGAVDFIVTSERQLLFLEINSAPGFTELSEGAYINAFDKLSDLSKTKILKFCV